MPSFTRLTILAFGVSSFSAGVFTLFDPIKFLQSVNLPPVALPAARANALAAIAMGIYYSLASYQNNESFFIATVPMRLLTATVFWTQGWFAASIWEGFGSITTGIALGWEKFGMKQEKLYKGV